jgi:hypothetical protein
MSGFDKNVVQGFAVRRKSELTFNFRDRRSKEPVLIIVVVRYDALPRSGLHVGFSKLTYHHEVEQEQRTKVPGPSFRRSCRGTCLFQRI